MDEEKEIKGAENPERFTGLKLSRTTLAAAGFPAVVSAASHMLHEMNPVRGVRALFALNQTKGYDCPGCAWPDPEERSALGEYCENGAKAIAEEATTHRVDAEFFAMHSVEELGALTDYEIGKKGRITEPVYLPKGESHYRKISWDEAFEKIAGHLNVIHPDEAVFYTSGRTSNEAAFLYQLFVRMYGTNNLPDCSNMCHESSGVALTESLGTGKGTVKLEDFYQAEVILICGQNPGTNHPRMLTALQKAKENGAYIISVNPLPETGLLAFTNPQTLKGAMGIKSKLTDLFLQVKINGDLALFKAIMLLLVDKEESAPGTVFDNAFIEEHTSGFRDYIYSLKQYNIYDLAEDCGVEIEKIKEAADVLASKKKVIACWAMGLTQHKNAVDTIKEIVNLLLAKGSIGKPGAGTCPVRGHSNVQGDRTMGIYEKPSESFLQNLEKTFAFKAPRKHGYDTVESIHAMHQGKAKVFIAMGGNFLSATPDTKFTAKALSHCRLTVHVSTKLNRSHLVTGEEALILPCLARSDKDLTGGRQQFVSTENSMGVVQLSRGNLKPLKGEMLSEPEIICRLAMKVKNASAAPWELYIKDYDHIRDAIEKSIPGFEKYNERVRKTGGFYLPNAARERSFVTLTGKAQYNIAVHKKTVLREGELLMMTIRSHDQFNTTIYGLNDRYRGVLNERRVVFMNVRDMEKRGLHAGDVVDLHNEYNGVRRTAHRFIVVEFNIPSGCTATYFPETNVLVPIDSTAEKSNTPASKSVAITVTKRNSDQ